MEKSRTLHSDAVSSWKNAARDIPCGPHHEGRGSDRYLMVVRAPNLIHMVNRCKVMVDMLTLSGRVDLVLVICLPNSLYMISR